MNKQTQAPSTEAQSTMIELDMSEVETASGGNMIRDAFDIGWAIGTWIDRTYIAPLWY